MGNDRRKLHICGGALFSVGVAVLIALVVVGAQIKNTIEEAPIKLLKYSLPEEYAKDANYTECKEETDGNQWNEYYFYNLTNLNDTLAGETAVFEVVGPYVLVHHTCDFDKTLDDKVLSWRVQDNGYYFIGKDSKGTMQDKITNFNPAYIGILKQTHGEQGLLASFAATGITRFIQGLQAPTFIAGTTSSVLSGIKQQALTSNQTRSAAAVIVNSGFIGTYLASNSSIENFFNNHSASALTVTSFANFVGADDLLTPTQAYNLFHGLFDNKGAGAVRVLAIATSSPADAGLHLATNYGVANSTVITYLLGYMATYLTKNDSIPALASSMPTLLPQAINGLFYAQWSACASGSATPLPGGAAHFEVLTCGAVPKLNLTDAATLWESPQSFTTQAGLQLWLNFANNQNALFAAFPSITPDKVVTVAGWLANFTRYETPLLLKFQYGITDLNDLAYLQWGQLATGFSLKTVAGLDFYPEIYNPTIPGLNTKFSLSEAKEFLSGTYGIMNPANLGALLAYGAAGNVSVIMSTWHISLAQIAAFQTYYAQLQTAMNLLLKPFINSQSSGLFVTRTLQDWIFDGQDPMLTLLQQPSTKVGLLKNKTITMDQARAAPILAKNRKRVFLGGNLDDVHHSLMPVDDGSEITYWKENVTRSGYAGTQFMPYDDVKKSDYPFVLDLWRQIPLEYAGESSFKGIPTLLVKPSAKTFEPDPIFFNQFQGLINVFTVPEFSGAPLFLSQPNFAGCEPAVTEHISIIDNIFPKYDPTDKLSTHRFAQYWSVQGLLGTPIQVNLPFQGSVQYNGDASVNYAGVKPMFAPLFWNAQGGQASDSQVESIKNGLLAGIILWKVLVAIGAVVGAVFIFAGIFYIFKARRVTAVIHIK